MVKRKIIEINEEQCTGCKKCIPECKEGALQIIDGKARLISDLFCDGLGACLGHCPEDAIKIIEREAEPYDEKKVMEKIVKAGANTIKAHLEHLQEHGETEYLKEAIEFLRQNKIENPLKKTSTKPKQFHGCPGSKNMEFSEKKNISQKSGKRHSMLRHWPIQLHLISPEASYYRNKDVLLSADCAAYTYGDFHKDHLKGKSLAIACPKLDSNKEVYVDKLISMIDDAKINSLTVMIMQVPCCTGLLQIAKQAVSGSFRKIPIKKIVVGIKGEILEKKWVKD
ncbi:4Fe-4S ferredoxin [Candidatus Woesearchaeota archaeon]|nr:4Fe-4S ferredoxin [Candidatus Woesearchaeota archaeon]